MSRQRDSAQVTEVQGRSKNPWPRRIILGVLFVLGLYLLVQINSCNVVHSRTTAFIHEETGIRESFNKIEDKPKISHARKILERRDYSESENAGVEGKVIVYEFQKLGPSGMFQQDSYLVHVACDSEGTVQKWWLGVRKEFLVF